MDNLLNSGLLLIYLGWGKLPEQIYQKRQIAYKTRIKDIVNSEYKKEEGASPNYIKINGKEISRVSVLGVVVQKSKVDNQNSILIDDGSEKIFVRDFENRLDFDDIGVGGFVLVIGRLREFFSEKYILMEIVKKTDASWAKVRKLELEKEIPENNVERAVEEKEVEEIVGESPKDKVLKVIKNLDGGEGVLVDDIPSEGVDDIDKIVDILLKEGDVFEVTPGKLKVLE